jgi:hydroxymethylpyrimidine pyrophosphatase-like HAD family hydrolase
MLDMITILNKNIQRNSLKNLNTEDLFLKYLDKEKLDEIFSSYNEEDTSNAFHYPTDGIKTAKDIAYNLQKAFNEYQKVYTDNYQQIRSILSESKSLGKNINTRQVDASLKELEDLYNDSKNSDVLSLRLTTLFQRLQLLSATEQKLDRKK